MAGTGRPVLSTAMTGEGRGDRTRRTMIDAAERLIAERGLAALSLREVAVEAGQRNHSAVQYHFGSRDSLVEAIFDARATPIDAAREVLLAELTAEGAVGDLARLCDVAVRPLAEAVAAEPVGWYGRFLAEVSRAEPRLLGLDRPGMAQLHRTSLLVMEAMVAVPQPLRAERLKMAMRSAVQMLADHEAERAGEGRAGAGRGRPQASGEVVVPHVVDLVHAMVSAPPSPALVHAVERSMLSRPSR